MPSRIPGRRRAAGLAGFAGLVLTIGLTLTGCDPSAAGDGATTTASSPAATTAPSSAPVAAPTTPAAPAPAAPVTPAGTSAPQPVVPAQPPATKAPQPQPKATTAQPPTDPQGEHTAAAGGGGQCELRSNAGNCYEAGQFCRNADLGKSTHEAGGRVIYCRMVSGKPHWQA
ncbi:hypothetical protein [Streptomyces sp. NRRL S-350]|uniref:hypothetical protein n=1 Tax=Streptomyces sp. NRRL S-350 TaxID=1463902 RepID=UPI000563495B|nr:hypothetical protein [Streptomyces sp. NRRL S-350]